jgi:hypothetical protein
MTLSRLFHLYQKITIQYYFKWHLLHDVENVKKLLIDLTNNKETKIFILFIVFKMILEYYFVSSISYRALIHDHMKSLFYYRWAFLWTSLMVTNHSLMKAFRNISFSVNDHNWRGKTVQMSIGFLLCWQNWKRKYFLYFI